MVRARQQRLPGTHGGIPELENLGFEYAALRDKRSELRKREDELKVKTLAVMKKCNLMNYRYGEIEIVRIPGEDRLKVKSNKQDEDD